MMTDNYKKHTSKNPLQRYLIGRFYTRLLSLVSRLDPQSVLDAGCGEGITLNKIYALNKERKLSGVDFQAAAIAIGKADHPHLDLKEGSIYALPYGDDSFDLVLCTEVLEHLEQPTDALKELRRVTKQYCIVSVPHEPYFRTANFLRGKNITRWGNDIEHIHNWSSSEIQALCSPHFEVVAAYHPFPWTMLVLKKQTGDSLS